MSFRARVRARALSRNNRPTILPIFLYTVERRDIGGDRDQLSTSIYRHQDNKLSKPVRHSIPKKDTNILTMTYCREILV